MPLQVAPDPFDVVELRGVFWQPLDREPVSALGERRAACFAGVDRAVVEHKHDGLARDPELGAIAAVDLLQESKEVGAALGPAGAHESLRCAQPSTLSMAPFALWPGAGTRRSPPFLAQTCARYGWVRASASSPNSSTMSPAS